MRLPHGAFVSIINRGIIFLPKPACTAAPPAPAPAKSSPLDAALKAVHPDSLTPREALDLVYSLKALTEDAGP